MKSSFNTFVSLAGRPRAGRPLLPAWVSFGLLFAGCGESTPPPPVLEVGSVAIESPSFIIERGYHATLVATVRDPKGETLAVPVVWRSTVERVATIGPDGRLTARDTGLTNVYASTLGVASQPIAVRVVWQGAAEVAAYEFTAPAAATPGVTMPDSLRVVVTNVDGVPVRNARVAFAVTAGGGSVSPALDTTDALGRAATQLTLGPSFGVNTVRATVISDDDSPLTFVKGNALAFSVTTFAALVAVQGDAQTGQILSPLPVAPSVRVVDAAGAPRPGVPVTFTPLNGGRVASTTVSTGSDGVASPGAWTLGDVTGAQSLVVTVESARLRFTATGTGTAIYYTPSQVIAGGYSTCGIDADGTADCFGEQPKVGDSTTTNRSVPTPTKGDVEFRSIDGSPAVFSSSFNVAVAHFCGVSTANAIYCWGLFAYPDTSGATVHAVKPTRVGSDVVWSQVSAGLAHNCALSAGGVAYCWGDNASGQLGDRTLERRFVPAPVAGGFAFSSITSGSSHSCALSTGGSAFCWGLNQSGQLGDGSTTTRLDPTAVAGGHAYQSIGAGEAFTCGLRTSGRAACWGFLAGESGVQATPREYTTGPVFTSLTVGGAHACGLAADGTAHCWGANSFGQLGDSTTTTRAAPVPVAGGFTFSSISAGYAHTCGRTTAGAVACWGANRAGELGDATVSQYRTPRRIVLGVTP